MMYNNNSCSNSASTARGLMTLCAGLAMGLGLGLMASPAEADVYAYVANDRSNNVSVIDTTTTPPSVVATVGVGAFPYGVPGLRGRIPPKEHHPAALRASYVRALRDRPWRGSCEKGRTRHRTRYPGHRHAISRPGFHELAPSLQSIAAPISRLR